VAGSGSKEVLYQVSFDWAGVIVKAKQSRRGRLEELAADL
jgi:hypothetical protein